MGWGSREIEIRSSAPSNVEFITFQRGAPLREMFGRALIFLFPSKGETFGIALVEAMASGCAIISSVPLHFEGIRISASDPAALRAAVRKLWQDRSVCAAMGLRNQQLAQQYSWQRYTDDLMACLDQACYERSA
jgi:glycosyltransferase involved in cell wall biosynthesis